MKILVGSGMVFLVGCRKLKRFAGSSRPLKSLRRAASTLAEAISSSGESGGGPSVEMRGRADTESVMGVLNFRVDGASAELVRAQARS